MLLTLNNYINQLHLINKLYTKTHINLYSLFILAFMKKIKERVVITGYSGSLAKKTAELLKNDYEIIGLTSNKKKVNFMHILYASIACLFLLIFLYDSPNKK